VAPQTNPTPSSAKTGGKPFLQINRIVKKFDGVFAVDEVTLDIQQGEIFALLGSSGCGKSTLLRMLAGFESPTSGQILLAGQDIVGLAPYERPINMMFQSYALFPHLTVWDNIAFGLQRDGMPRDQIAERVGQMLELVQLKQYASRTSSPAASSSAWRWHAAWPSGPSSCCWTNHWAR
jgi:putrescine transport system ATP-binding protein